MRLLSGPIRGGILKEYYTFFCRYFAGNEKIRFPRPKSLSLNSLGVCIFREEENFKSVAYFSILMKLICN